MLKAVILSLILPNTMKIKIWIIINQEIYALRSFREIENMEEKMRIRNRKGATELLEFNPQYVVLHKTCRG